MFTYDKTPVELIAHSKKYYSAGPHPFSLMRFHQRENAWLSEYNPFYMRGYATRLFPVLFADAILSECFSEWKIVDLMLRMYYI